MRARLLVALLLPACALAAPAPTPTPSRATAGAPTIAATAPPTTTATPPTSTRPPSPATGSGLPQPAVGDTVPEDPAWPVLGFLRGWQQRDFPAMALSSTSGRTGAEAMAAQYDFRPLRGAEVVAVERRGADRARVDVRVWYEFPPGRIVRKRVGLVVERTDAPRTAATGPSPWRVNAASAAGEQDDP